MAATDLVLDLIRVPGEVYGTSPDASHCPVRETTIIYVGSSEILLQWALLLSQMRQYSLQRHTPDKHVVMQRRQQIYSAMRKSISSQTGNWSDSTLYGVAYAAMAEHRLGNAEVAQVHLAACISVWADRRANGAEPLPFAVATIILYDLVMFGLSSMLSSVHDADLARKHAVVTLKVMERWHFLRRQRILRRRAMKKYHGDLESSTGFETLRRCMIHTLADQSVESTRLAIATVYTLSVGLWWRRQDDSTVSALLQNLDRCLETALPIDSNGMRALTVSPSGLIYTTAAVLYSEMGSTMDYERVINWHTAQLIELLMQLPRSEWENLKDAIASWIFGAMSLDQELLHFDTGSLEHAFP